MLILLAKMEEIIKFKINNENVELTFPNDDEVIYRLRNEDEFAVEYVMNLLNNGYLSLAEPVKEVYRLEDDRETLLYSSDAVVYTENIEENQENIQKAEWTEAETKLLLDLYQESLPMKKYKTKKHMWQDISKNINNHFKINRNATQVENRYKTVLKRKKAAVENNTRSGSLRQTVPYEFELNKISALDDSIEPEVLGSASGVRILKENHLNIPCEADIPSTSRQESSLFVDTDSLPGTAKQEPSGLSSRRRAVLKPRKGESITQVLKLIHKEKQETRERHHKEKLELIRELLKK